MNSQKILYWLPRILGVLYIFIVSLFNFYTPEMNLGFWSPFVELFIHFIPSLILAVLLAIAWKLKRLGAIIYTCFSVILLIYGLLTVCAPYSEDTYIPSLFFIVVLLLPLLLNSILFLIQSSNKQLKTKN